MLKKYLNRNNAPFVFLNFALLLILCYSIALTLFLSMPPEEMLIHDIFEQGIDIMENIICSGAVTALFFFVMRLMFTYRDLK